MKKLSIPLPATPVIWKSYDEKAPNKDYWDMGILKAIFGYDLWMAVNSRFYVPEDDFLKIRNITTGTSRWAENYGAVVIIPARYAVDKVKQINEDISRLSWCLLILAGDEEGLFPVEEIKHPNIKIWLMTPHIEKNISNVDRFIGEGWPPLAPKALKQYEFEQTWRKNNWFFAGQVTHKRRLECIKQLRNLENGQLIETKGFTQGVPQQLYYEYMANAKVIPCPSGPETPDTFRVYEALEAGCVPIVDAISAKSDALGYWQLLFGEDIPFPVIENWEDLPGHIQYHSDVYPRTNNKVFAWWQKQKRQFVYDLEDDINFLSGTQIEGKSTMDKITVLVPTSPIPDHPDTSMLEETIATIRSKLPESEIIIMIDGIRAEQEDRRADYEEYKRRILYKTNFEWNNVLPLVFEEHHHQAAMTREALKLVRTPVILFVEHDTPITPDCEFEWLGMIDAIENGYADVIRFHFESHILADHAHLMLDEEPQLMCGVKLIRTAQWSQRPHLASTEFYKRILQDHFSQDARTMIEDKMHGVVSDAYFRRQKAGWNNFKICIYAPDGNIKRSYHLDGRKSDPKFDMTF